MKNLKSMNRIWIFAVIVLLSGAFIACKQGSANDTEETVDQPTIQGGAVIALSSDPGWSRTDDDNPIPPNWRPIFRWVANGAVDSLGRLFTEGMYFALQDNISTSPQEARSRLSRFYRENPPRSFAYKHHGQSSSGIAQYAIGELATANTNYRVTVVIQHGLVVSMDIELP